jgi:nucleoside-diphosphate-sugar epimerase
VYNAAGPRPTSLREVVEVLAKIIGWRGEVRWGLNPRPVDPNYLLVDTSKLRRLGWMPVYDLDKGLRDYVEKLLAIKYRCI